MTQNFLPHSTLDPHPIHPHPIPSHPIPHREPIHHILKGSLPNVTRTIHDLYHLGYAEPTAWSPSQPTGKPNEVISVLIRHLLCD